MKHPTFDNFHSLADYLHNKGSVKRSHNGLKDSQESRRDDYTRAIRGAGDSSCSYTYADFQNITTGKSHEKSNETNSK